ncbi:hypothetical protein DAEQUDRAFT_138032 [Daedalea quercina L-15889]|uniref:Uncharacterized protein n=1 Tax=Daedalea quercina L-15889 TaxID=1314783 RepID=A0A165RST3_9APHY|nr:hypothetical protein DAEQUDRAFT_138032 [Daedalea quercina L-15889]
MPFNMDFWTTPSSTPTSSPTNDLEVLIAGYINNPLKPAWLSDVNQTHSSIPEDDSPNTDVNSRPLTPMEDTELLEAEMDVPQTPRSQAAAEAFQQHTVSQVPLQVQPAPSPHSQSELQVMEAAMLLRTLWATPPLTSNPATVCGTMCRVDFVDRTFDNASVGVRMLDLLRMPTKVLRNGNEPHAELQGRDYIKLHINWMNDLMKYTFIFCRDEDEDDVIQNDDDLPPASLGAIGKQIADVFRSFMDDHAVNPDGESRTAAHDPRLGTVYFSQVFIRSIHSFNGFDWILDFHWDPHSHAGPTPPQRGIKPSPQRVWHDSELFSWPNDD